MKLGPGPHEVRCLPGTPEVTAELRACVKVEVAVLGSPSLISLMVSVDVKHHENKEEVLATRAQELCECPGGRPGPKSSYVLCGRKAN